MPVPQGGAFFYVADKIKDKWVVSFGILNEARDELQVITPIYGSPAHKAGMKANDIITTIISIVDPKTGTAYDEPIVTPTKGLPTDDAVKKIEDYLKFARTESKLWPIKPGK